MIWAWSALTITRNLQEGCLQSLALLGEGSEIFSESFNHEDIRALFEMSVRMTHHDYIVLVSHVLYFAHLLMEKWNIPHPVYQDVNRFVHRAENVFAWYDEHSGAITYLDYPAKFSDLNLFGNLWDHLEQQVTRQDMCSSILLDLRNSLIQEWQNTDVIYIRTLIQSMSDWTTAVITARGSAARTWHRWLFFNINRF